MTPNDVTRRLFLRTGDKTGTGSCRDLENNRSSAEMGAFIGLVGASYFIPCKE
jgi:hypothetical protein